MTRHVWKGGHFFCPFLPILSISAGSKKMRQEEKKEWPEVNKKQSKVTKCVRKAAQMTKGGRAAESSRSNLKWAKKKAAKKPKMAKSSQRFDQK